MKRTSVLTLGLLTAAALLAAPSAAEAQLSTSVSAGVAGPTGDAGDIADTGFTVQGRVGLSLLVAGLHANGGFTRLPGKDSVGADDADVWNVGVGAKFGLAPLLWVGANANYYTGDGSDEMGIVPEIGVSIGPLEAIADYKVTGDVKFWSLRVGIGF